MKVCNNYRAEPVVVTLLDVENGFGNPNIAARQIVRMHVIQMGGIAALFACRTEAYAVMGPAHVAGLAIASLTFT